MYSHSSGFTTNFFYITGLQKTCAAVMDEGYEIASYVVDLADRSAVYAAAEKLKKEVLFCDFF